MEDREAEVKYHRLKDKIRKLRKENKGRNKTEAEEKGGKKQNERANPEHISNTMPTKINTLKIESMFELEVNLIKQKKHGEVQTEAEKLSS